MLNTGMEYDGENLREVATPDGARYRRDFDRVGRLYKLTDQFVQEPYPPARRLTPGAQLDYTPTGHRPPPAKLRKSCQDRVDVALSGPGPVRVWTRTGHNRGVLRNERS